jgi:hypothetical protein
MAYQLFMNKCLWWSCAPNRDFTVFDLNLPAEFFPNATETPLLKQDRGIIDAIEEARGASNWVGGGAVYIVYRFATESQAERWFQLRAKKNFFTDQLENTNVMYSDVLIYQSQVADTYIVQCGYVVDRTSCIYLAQYKEYYIFFNGYISETGLSVKNYLGVLNFIDNKMLELLY